MSKIILVAISLLLAITPAFAAGFQLDAIGSLSTGGQLYSQWWYQGENPIITGKTAANETVEVSVNDQSQTITASDTGTWSFTPTTLTTGSHQVSLTSLGSTISFTLHINQDMPAGSGAPATPEQPIAGNLSLTLGVLTLGAILLLTGLKLAPATLKKP
jgi:hypothetical protein